MPGSAITVVLLPVDDLHPNSWNPNIMRKDQLEGFVAEVRRTGRLAKPIVVRAVADGSYEIVDGEHGWFAARAVGLAEVPCEVIVADEFEARRQTYFRNQRGRHNRVLDGRLFEEMLAERGLSQAALATENGISAGSVRNALEYARAGDLRRAHLVGRGIDGDEADRIAVAQIDKLTVRGLVLYLRLPDGIRDPWLDAGADPALIEQAWAKDRRHAARVGRTHPHDQETRAAWLQEISESGIARVIVGTDFVGSLCVALDLLRRRRKLQVCAGDAVDEYLTPVIELASTRVFPDCGPVLADLPIGISGQPLLSTEGWASIVRASANDARNGAGFYTAVERHISTALDEIGVNRESVLNAETAAAVAEAPAFVRDAALPSELKRELAEYEDWTADPNDVERAQRRLIAVLERATGNARAAEGDVGAIAETLRRYVAACATERLLTSLVEDRDRATTQILAVLGAQMDGSPPDASARLRDLLPARLAHLPDAEFGLLAAFAIGQAKHALNLWLRALPEDSDSLRGTHEDGRSGG